MSEGANEAAAGELGPSRQKAGRKTRGKASAGGGLGRAGEAKRYQKECLQSETRDGNPELEEKATAAGRKEKKVSM